ncbi:hypothetical protein [Schumannella sp. 10F1B-5-1]|uniref:hypothetical protein n=1 Tax=Schumannella sp. 10F1B-5-1 TaxID=2590780 RepID=UPI001130B352|nr:hypothetical protein [Schumannella sp. 10F1B-5-1]TPW78516.1 hypothetical protein FJ658_01620 [Schumannella sp. 10F1B-5-1]
MARTPRQRARLGGGLVVAGVVMIGVAILILAVVGPDSTGRIGGSPPLLVVGGAAVIVVGVGQLAVAGIAAAISRRRGGSTER